VAEAICVDHAQLGIREDRVVEAGRACELRVRRDRVDDDAGDRGAARSEFLES
jgi:hypothetical protein